MCNAFQSFQHRLAIFEPLFTWCFLGFSLYLSYRVNSPKFTFRISIVFMPNRLVRLNVFSWHSKFKYFQFCWKKKLFLTFRIKHSVIYQIFQSNFQSDTKMRVLPLQILHNSNKRLHYSHIKRVPPLVLKLFIIRRNNNDCFLNRHVYTSSLIVC